MNRFFLLAAFAFCSCAQAQSGAPAAPGARPAANVAAPGRNAMVPPALEEGGPLRPVALGKGSYASVAAPEEAKAAAVLGKTLYLLPEAQGRPIPTNQWWTNVLVDKYAGQMWSFPHQTRATADGIEIFYPNRWNTRGSDPVSENPLRIGAREFRAEDARAKNWSDWLVSFRLGQDADRYMDVTLGRGLPYVWVEPRGVVPVLQLDAGTSFFTLDGGNALPQAGTGLGITYGARSYGIFVPEGTRFVREGDRLALEFAAAKPWLTVAMLSRPEDLALFARYSGAIPRQSRLEWSYSPEQGEVTTRWHLETELLRGQQKGLLQGWLPHHYRDTVNTFQFAGPEYLSPRGTLKLAAGTDFTLTYPFRGLPFSLPAPATTGLPNDYDPARMKEYVQRYSQRTNYGADTYWGGKHLLQWGQYLWIARAMDDPAAANIANSLRNALADWFTYTPGEKEHYFARYPAWKALIGFKTSYGSEAFNDQHFHYGYFTSAGALLGFQDKQFLRDYGPMLRLVAKQYANWERADSNFPFLRTFDCWEGHSWAGGFSSPTGNNQESSSEAMQSWAGLFWLGQAMEDKEMTAAGAMGYAMEARATQEYWFNQRGGNWYPNWKHEVVGMVWSGGNLYGTYFSGDPAWIWGIQWLPMTPALAFLVEDKEFARRNFEAMWTAKRTKDPDASVDKMGPSLGNVILGQSAQLDPDGTAAQLDDLWARGSKVVKENDTPGLVYYLTHTNRTLGDIDWATRIAHPLSRTYLNARNGKYTYLAFNPGSAPVKVNVLRGGKTIGVLTLAPGQWTVTDKLEAAGR